MSRAATLILALLVLHVLLGGLCLAISRGPNRSAALRAWGWGLIAYAAGLACTMLGALGSVVVTNTLGNTLIAWASVLCAQGVLIHGGVRVSRLWSGAGVAAVFVVLAFANTAGFRALTVNVVAPTVLATVMFIYAAIVIARRGPADAAAACRVLAAILVVAVATWWVRAAWLEALVENGMVTAQAMDVVFSFAAIAQMVNGVVATMALVWIDVRLMQVELSRVADSDPLTGLPNRRAAMNRFAEEAARAARNGQRFGLAVLDIDHFKRINDRHGHVAGDAVLNEVGRALRLAKRGDDMLGRLGGEEFVLILPQQAREGASDAAQRLREAVARAAVVVGGETVRVTVSGGVAIYPEDGENWDTLFSVADRRLYDAKREGRDRITVSG